MNYLNLNPLELAVKLIALQNDRVRHLASSISKVKTLVHANQLCNQIDNYQRIASFAFSCYFCEKRNRILEHCSHGINDYNNELRKLTRDTLLDKTLERLTDTR